MAIGISPIENFTSDTFEDARILTGNLAYLADKLDIAGTTVAVDIERLDVNLLQDDTKVTIWWTGRKSGPRNGRIEETYGELAGDWKAFVRFAITRGDTALTEEESAEAMAAAPTAETYVDAKAALADA